MVHFTKISMICLLMISMVYGSLTTILIVLGCSDNMIQQERINAANEFINNSDNNIKLYLSGGVKNAILSNEVSEASIMANTIKNKDIEIILDDKAKNTAENFAYLKKWIHDNLSNNGEMLNFVITTSDYHKNRAETIFNGILPEINPLWNLSISQCTSCWNDEHIHMRNVKSDIHKSFHIFTPTKKYEK